MTPADATHWPDGTPRSTGNGFPHGMGDTPHGYVTGQPAAPARIPKNVRNGDFGGAQGHGQGLERRRA